MIFIKKYWTSIVLAAILIFVLFYNQNKYDVLAEQVEALEAVNKELTIQSNLYLEEIEVLSKVDTIIIKEIEYIKIKEDEAIVAVDTMSVSDLQSYFTGRYK